MADALRLAPGRGYLKAGAHVAAGAGLTGYAEGAWRVRDNVALVAQGQIAGPNAWAASAGVRVTW